MQYYTSEQMKKNHGVGRKSENSNPRLVVLITRLISFFRRKVFSPNKFTGMNFFLDFDE
jgi:hypothetical protein